MITCIIFEILVGSIASGWRKLLNRARDTNADCAFRTFLSFINTNIPNDTVDTFYEINWKFIL